MGRAPFRVTLPRRIKSKAWEREQKPSLESARARPTLFEMAVAEGRVLFAGRTVDEGEFSAELAEKTQRGWHESQRYI